MKRLIAAFVLLFTVMALIITSNITISKSCTALIEKTQECEKAFKDNKSTEAALSELSSYWEKTETMLLIFANHEALEEIGYSISRLKAGDSEDFLKESSELKERLRHLKISESFTKRTFF